MLRSSLGFTLAPAGATAEICRPPCGKAGEPKISIAETDLWECRQKVSHADTGSLLNCNLFPLQIQASGSKRINSVIIAATTVRSPTGSTRNSWGPTFRGTAKSLAVQKKFALSNLGQKVALKIMDFLLFFLGGGVIFPACFLPENGPKRSTNTPPRKPNTKIHDKSQGKGCP